MPRRNDREEHTPEDEEPRPRCGSCGRPLGKDEAATCRACVADAREDLGAILEPYGMLPSLLGQLGSAHPKLNPVRATERPLPGGDPLVMLGAGSGADNTRRDDAVRRRADPGAPQFWGLDDRAGDPVSVAHELGRHEDDWRRVRHEPGAPGPATVATAVDYLRVNLSWAASHHDGFGDFTADIRSLRRKLEAVAGTASVTLAADAPCLDCEGVLLRHYRDRIGESGGGLDDDWTCAACRREYTEVGYLLACAAHLEREAARDAAKRAAAEGGTA